MPIVSDNFNRPNEPLTASPAWAIQTGTSGSFDIVSNQLVASAVDITRVAYRTDISPGPHQFSEITVESLSGDRDYGPAVCIDDGTGSNYALSLYVFDPQIVLNVGSAGSNAGSITLPTLTLGDKVALERDGTALRVYHNGSLVETITDATLTGGAIGVYGYSALCAMDNFRGGDGSPVGAGGPRGTNPNRRGGLLGMC
jgi:hypothetical protein